MATDKIYFNNTTNLVTLKGVYYNGTKIEGCKGIKLNGDVVVSFETAGLLNWSDYVNAYNNVWTSTNSTAETAKMSKITQENEFAITGARNLLYIRNDLVDNAEFDTLFNFNADGRLYVGNNDLIAKWQLLKGSLPTSAEETVTIATNCVYLKQILTGLPLLYKRYQDASDESRLNFASTGIVVDVKRESSMVPSSDWALVCSNNLIDILHYGGHNLSLDIIADSINYFLDETGKNRPAQVVKRENMIVIRGTENWDSDGICNLLCNVYLDGFGPYAGTLRESTDYLPPNNDFDTRISDYWKVDSNDMVSIQICDLDYYDTNNGHGCDFYILTAWGALQVNNSVNLSSEYTVQGEGNETVNVMYFDTSALAGYEYPNILVKMNCIFQPTRPDFLESAEWTSTSGGYSYIFPDNCPYTLSADVVEPEIDASQWAVINNLGNITWIVVQDYETNDDIYNMLAPQDIADTVFNWYKTAYPDLFLASGTGNTDETFILELKARQYPATADYGDSSFSISEQSSIWYLNAYDPYNVGGYYPVKKTSGSDVGTMYNTVCNYTAQ